MKGRKRIRKKKEKSFDKEDDEGGKGIVREGKDKKEGKKPVIQGNRKDVEGRGGGRKTKKKEWRRSERVRPTAGEKS